ncbi:hypothetical protein D9M70_644130 [compost metagenome]
MIRGGDDATIAYYQVRPDDHPNIINLQSLACMDAPNLLNGLLRNNPQAPVLAEIPLSPVIANHNVIGTRILLASP